MATPVRNSPKLPQPLPPPANRRSPDAVMDQLHTQLANVAEQARLIENTADAENRAMTSEEVENVQKLHAEFEGIEAEIDARVRAQKMDERLRTPRERVTQPEALDVEANADDGDEQPAHVPQARPRAAGAKPARFTGGEPTGARKGSGGFRSFGEFAIAAKATHNGKGDPRIMNAPSSYGQEAVGADGGFALPPDFRQSIMKTVMAEDSLLGRTDQQTTSSNAITLPLDTTTPWQTSGGVLGAWMGEGATIAGSKPQLGQLECRANKLGALVPVTDELLEDVPAMTRWLETKVPEKFSAMINEAIINGDGVMKPRGMLNSTCKITQAAESGQGAGTVVAKNILKMWGRLYGKLRPNAVWLINQDVEQQLQQLTMPGTNPSQPAYMPPGGFSQSPYASLLGRPIIPLEACQAVGTEGDIILCDPTQYLTVLKSGGMRSDVSIHLYFDSDHTAFRFVMRIGGQSYWPAAIARAHGSNTLSPIVTLNSTRT